MFDKAFWIATLERALKTAAQFGLFALGTTVWTDVGDVVSTSKAVGVSVLFGAAMSVLTSIASSQVGPPGPSLVGESVTAPPGIVDPTPDPGETSG
jgi:hypothetical protein